MTTPSTRSLAIPGAAGAPTRTNLKGGWRGVVPNIGNLTGVTELLRAKHRDLILDEGLHEHVWTVTAYYPSKPFRDGRALKAALRCLLDALPDAEGALPPELWSGEAIAERVMVLANCVGASVIRPEGFEAWASPSDGALGRQDETVAVVREAKPNEGTDQ